MSNKFISIIMPNLNGDKYLQRSIESFLKQSYPDKELIVVDGRSTDRSHRIIEEYSKSHSSIKWIKEPDTGISSAINMAIPESRGDIIGYLGNDDILMKDIFVKIATLEPEIDFDAIFFDSYTYYINERRCVLQTPVTPIINFENLLAHGTIVGLQNIYFRRRIFSDVLFNPNNYYSMDFEILLELSIMKAMFLYCNEVATINIFDNNITYVNPNQKTEVANVARFFSDKYQYQGKLFCEDLSKEAMDSQNPKSLLYNLKNLYKNIF